MSDSILLWAVNVLLQVTCLSGLGLAIAAFARRHATAKYWVLCSALLLMLLSPFTAAVMQGLGGSLISVEAQTGLGRGEEAQAASLVLSHSEREEWVSLSPTTAVINEGAAASAASSALAGDVERSNPPQSAPAALPSHLGSYDAPQPSRFELASIVPASANSLPEGAQPSRASNGPRVWRLLADTWIGVWLVVAALLLTRLARNWRQLGRILKAAAPNTNPALAEMFAHVAREIRLERAAELVFSSEVSGPVSAGLLRPRIMLPTQLVDKVSAAQMHDILVHEAAHVIRRDPWTALVQNVAGAIYWLHPLALWLNRALAQAREEVCDNFVLATTSAPSYSRTLLALAEVVTPRLLPGAVGLFTSRWRLENRVAGLLDEHRSRLVELGTRAKLLIAASSLVVAAVAAGGTITVAAGQDSNEAATSEQAESEKSTDDVTTNADETALVAGPMVRGEGENLEMLLRGRVLDHEGRPARDFDLVAKAYNRFGRDELPAELQGNEFEVWVPIGGQSWSYAQLAATADDGDSRAFEGIGNRELRQAAIHGVDLRLAPTDRKVEISVTHNGAPVANAHLNAEVEGNLLLSSQTDANGRSTLRLREGERLRQLTAWTDDFRIGGYLFNRKPRRDPLGTEFTIELNDCRDQIVRFLHEVVNSPVPNVPFDLVLGTGRPNYNFVGIPETFPHCRLTTDENGEAICRWFPDWETHGAYVEIVDPRWATAVKNSNWRVDDDGALVMMLKRRVDRKPIVGRVQSDRFDVGGFLVEIKSFQGEEEGHSDHVYAFTDAAGNFTSDIIPGATYTVCVNDGRLLSHMIDLIPYEVDTGTSNVPVLEVREGVPVEIRVTSGLGREPMRNQSVYVRQSHDYTWMEDGEERSGRGARDYPVSTDDKGVARARALPGTELRITVYAGEWRSEEHHVTVMDDDVTLVEIHRELDEEREVEGRLVAPSGMDVDLAGAEVIYGSIDGNTDEREVIAADAEGRFAFKTKSIQLGIFAYTTDGRTAGVVRPESLDGPIELTLKPTMDLHGQLLGPNDEPLANHAVRVSPRVSGERNFNTSFATSFQTKDFETRTDANGNYTIERLPAELEMTLRAEPIDGSDYDTYLGDFFLAFGEQRPRMVSRLGRGSVPDDRPLSEQYDGVVRDARLGGYHVLVLSYDEASEEFVNTQVLDHETTREVMSFLNLRIEEGSLTDDADSRFAELKNWPQPAPGKVFACAMDETGLELGRIELDAGSPTAAAEAAAFIREYAPPQADAIAKWDAAFAEARRSGRRVWAQVGQRYCGPCFRLARWLDDNRALLERDYVLLKIDNVRDQHGAAVASRIVSNRDHFGIPFHSIFDRDERLLIDSESPIGNIGHPSSFEGRRHVAKMLRETRNTLTEAEIEDVVGTLED